MAIPDRSYELYEKVAFRILRSVGWTPERRVEIEDGERRLAQDGWRIFPEARDFLDSFCGLPEIHLSGITNGLLFTTDRGDSHELYENFEQVWGRKIYPVGEYETLFVVFIDESGRLMFSDLDDWMYVFNENIYLAILQLLFGSDDAVKLPLNFPDD